MRCGAGFGDDGAGFGVQADAEFDFAGVQAKAGEGVEDVFGGGADPGEDGVEGFWSRVAMVLPPTRDMRWGPTGGGVEESRTVTVPSSTLA